MCRLRELGNGCGRQLYPCVAPAVEDLTHVLVEPGEPAWRKRPDQAGDRVGDMRRKGVVVCQQAQKIRHKTIVTRLGEPCETGNPAIGTAKEVQNRSLLKERVQELIMLV